jgi:UDP-4-amino-4,6-dideoxy-N-acetyl-beta-L-altrosamine transaminase
MTGFLPYGRQTIEDDDIAAVTAALRDDFLTTGPRVEAFEQGFAAKVGADHAVVCANGTAALHLSMLALKVGPGDVAIVPSTTFLATANCARFVGADVVFADVDPASGLMTRETLEAAIRRARGRRIAAVLPVHLRGDVADLPAIRALAESVGAAVVEDSCHALGSTADFGAGVEPVGAGRHGDMAVFSFHPVKTIATAEGGMITTNDPEVAARARRLRGHGMERPADADPWVYDMAEVGLNYRLPDVLCALGLSQLAKLDRFVERRRALAAHYAAALAPLGDLVRPAARPVWSNPALHLMTVLIDFEATGRSRAEVVAALKARGIGSQVHYIPVHTQPYYRAIDPDLSLPGAEAWYARALSLPLYPGMADEDPYRVVDAVQRALKP